MAISRSARISILLAIDVCFFFLELIVGKNSYLSHNRAVELNGINLLRIFRRLARAHCRQLSHAQVRIYLTIQLCAFSLSTAHSSLHPNSDVMSLVVALYAIKVSYALQFPILYTDSQFF